MQTPGDTASSKRGITGGFLLFWRCFHVVQAVYLTTPVVRSFDTEETTMSSIPNPWAKRPADDNPLRMPVRQTPRYGDDKPTDRDEVKEGGK